MTRYQHLADLLAARIEQGLYGEKEKLPSVRTLSQQHGVSISTVQQLSLIHISEPTRHSAISRMPSSA